MSYRKRIKKICDILTIVAIRYVVPSTGILVITLIPFVCAKETYESRIVSHDLEIELCLKEHRMKAIDHILMQCANAEKVSCFINRSFQILSVSSLNRKLDFTIKNTPAKGDSTSQDGVFRQIQYLEILIPSDLRKLHEILLDIEYEGTLPSTPNSLDEEDVGETIGIIGEEGVYLSPAYMWYPDTPYSLTTFKLTVITPVGYEAVTQGTQVSKKSIASKTYTVWEEKNVSEGCHLVAGKYTVTNIKHEGIDIYAFFFPEEQGLVKTYINATTRYLDMYQRLLGNYPYGKFAIVENFFQTGYGMPSFTFLGQAVVKLPFIVETSLGHEILHNWWGNTVFVEESQGNWCEGLTSYMADYYYKELKDITSAEDYRKDICRKYTNYVTEQNDLPLKKFIRREDQATQAIGYGKTAMVFHMLRRLVGDDLFYQSLRRFYQDKIWQKASWKDIQHIFEDTSKLDLSWFFGQWINKKGAPCIELGKTEVKKRNDGWLTTIEIIQKDTPYRLSLPIQLGLDDENIYTVVEIKEGDNLISIQTKTQPRHIAIDPQCDVFRRLHSEEIPPTIDLVLGDHDKVIVLPTSGELSLQSAYRKLANFLSETGGVIRADTEVTETEMAQKSLFILGGLENKLTRALLEKLPENFSIEEGAFTVNNVAYNGKGDALLITSKNPKNKEKGIALFLGLGSDTVWNLGFKLTHYGKYSYLVFTGEKNVDKGTFPITNNPLQRYFINESLR